MSDITISSLPLVASPALTDSVVGSFASSAGSGRTTLASILGIINTGGTITSGQIGFGQGTAYLTSSVNFSYNGTYLRVGTATPLSGATNPIIATTGTANNYIQTYVLNTQAGASSSSDFVVYTNTSTDAHGWGDLGFTSSVYADATYTVTGPHEAYVFGSAPSGSTGTGNLVLCTDSTGTANAIQLYVGGFTQAKTAYKFQLDSLGNIMTKPQTAVPTLTVNGDMVFNLTSNTNLRISVRGSDGVTRVTNLTLA